MLALLQLVICVVLFCAPLVMLAVFDNPKPFGGKSFQAFPPAAALVHDSSSGRDALADALQERMWAKKWSVSARNWFDYKVLDFVDTPKVVSGLDGFLFTKKSLRRFSCDFRAVTREEFEPFVQAVSLAKRAQVRLLLAVSPNKGTVHAEHFGGRLNAYSRCYAQKSREQRTLYSQKVGQGYVDHLQSVLQLKSRSGEGYFKGDTHWKPHMVLAILQDLYLALDGSDPGFIELPVEYGKVRIGGDLENQLIIRRADREMKPVRRALGRRLKALHKIPQKTLILHDSFYQTKKELISNIFDDSAFFHLDDAMEAISGGGALRDEFYSAVSDAQIIVVSVAERNVRSRLRKLSPFLLEEMLRRNSGG